MVEERFSQPRDVAEILADRHLNKAVLALKPGMAPDRFGWTTETWLALFQNPAVQPILKELLVQYATGQCGSIARGERPLAVPDGGAELAATTMAAANNLTGERLILRTDIQVAFNDIRRHVVYEILSYVILALVASQYAWLSRPTHAVLDNPTSANVVLSTTTGIPPRGPAE